MADGRWSMTEKELNNTATGFRGRNHEKLPNYKKHRKVDNRDGNAPRVCAFCGSENLEEGFGGYAPGFSTRERSATIVAALRILFFRMMSTASLSND